MADHANILVSQNYDEIDFVYTISRTIIVDAKNQKQTETLVERIKLLEELNERIKEWASEFEEHQNTFTET